MRRMLTLILLGTLLLAGCVTLTPQTAQQQLRDPVAPDVAYNKATRVATKSSGQMTSQDPMKRVMSVRVDKAVVLGVILTPEGTGTLVDVRGTAEAGYILTKDIGQYVQEFLTAYRQEK